MTKGQLWIAVIVVVIILIIGEVIVHSHTQSSAQAGPTAAQITAANDCIVLCQTAFYSESDAAGSSNQEQACENDCNKSAGISASTTSS